MLAVTVNDCPGAIAKILVEAIPSALVVVLGV